MGIGDLMKKAAAKAAEKGKEAMAAGAAAINQAVEEGKKMQEQARQNYERHQAMEARLAAEKQSVQPVSEEEDNRRREQRFAEMMEPTCDKGDCIFSGKILCCSCPEDCQCERKTYANCEYMTEYPELWKYFKLLKQHDKFEEVKEEGNLYPSTQKDDEYFYQMFCDEFLPNYKGSDAHNVAAWFIKNTLTFWWNDDFYKFAFAVIRTANTWGDLEQLSWKLSSMLDMRNLYRLKTDYDENPIYCSYTLFNRSLFDFRKTVFCLLGVENKGKLMDDNFEILPYGEGGPAKGFYGPCIYNIMNKYMMYNITDYLSKEPWYNKELLTTPEPRDLSQVEREFLWDDDDEEIEENDE